MDNRDKTAAHHTEAVAEKAYERAVRAAEDTYDESLRAAEEAYYASLPSDKKPVLPSQKEVDQQKVSLA